MLKKNVTLKDVAQIAGVSTATVARVLHKQGYIAEETRTRVEGALQQTGYQLNIVAQGLRTQSTMSIGHLLRSISPNPFFAGVALGAEQEALKYGWSIVAVNVQNDARRERLGVETLIQRRVDAILFTTPVDEANIRLALDAGLIVVQVERPTSVLTHEVTVDNYVGSVAAMEHLLALGHRRIAYIGENPQAGTLRCRVVEKERFSGYKDTLDAHGIAIEEDLIAFGQYFSSTENSFMSDGYTYMQQFLQRRRRPTAVFAASDVLAAGVLQALYESHLRVPDDISVVGFDNTYAPYLSPPLTTVEQPMNEIGKQAVRLVLDNLQTKTDDTAPLYQQVRLATRLIINVSTGSVSGL